MISTVLLSILASAAGANALLVSPPSGPYAVSSSVEALTDKARLDPYAPANDQHSRRVLISYFMPVDESKTPCAGRKTYPYMTPLLAKAYDSLGATLGPPNGTFSSLEMEFCAPKTTTPCRPSPGGKYPLVLFSPGWGNSRLLYGALAREVASHGYAVVTIDHPYDPSFVEFPDGTVYRAVDIDGNNNTAIMELTNVRAKDTSFVLNHLYRKRVPGMDFKKTIMFGHSLGGATAAAVMLSDPRIMGGMDLDGTLFNPALETGLNRPFALVGRLGHENEDPTWDTFYNASKGPRTLLAINGTTHASFTDYPTLIHSLNMTIPAGTLAVLQKEIGTLEFGRSGEVVAGIVGAFADLVLNAKVGPIFTTGDSKFPEVSVVKFDKI